MPRNFKVGDKIRLMGVIDKIELNGSAHVLLEAGECRPYINRNELSHAEIIEEPVKKKPSEIIAERALELVGTSKHAATPLITAILEYLDEQANTTSSLSSRK